MPARGKRSDRPGVPSGPPGGADRRGGGAAPGDPSLLYGRHAVTAALANPARRPKRLWATRDALEALAADGSLSPAGRDLHARTAPCDRAAIERILPDGAVHQGLALDAAALPERLLDDLLAEAPAAPAPLRLVVLDRVTDPQNVGTVLRSAAAFGAAALVMPDRHAPPVTGTLAKAASGMLERVPILRVANLARALETMQTAGIWTIGLDGTAGTTLAEAAPPSRTALVLGAEGSGLRRLTAERCDMLAKLPMAPGVESLNVSAAAAAALYELARI